MTKSEYGFTLDSDTGVFCNGDGDTASGALEITTEPSFVGHSNPDTANTTGSGNGNITITTPVQGKTIPTTGGTGLTGGITYSPYSPISTSSTFTVGSDIKKYSVFTLPKPDVVPNKVYVSGRLLTVGILGSDVQAAFNGKDKLVFAPGEINIVRYNEKLTISLDYGDWLYHYNVEFDEFGAIKYEEDSNIVKVKLVSKVAQR